MNPLQDHIIYRTQVGQTVRQAGLLVTPISKEVVLRLPYLHLAWRWPSAIIVERADGQERLPIVDFTRLFQFGMFAIGAFLILVMWLIGSASNNEDKPTRRA